MSGARLVQEIDAFYEAADVPVGESVIVLLTNCILVDSSTVICWTSPFVILGVLGLFCCFYSIFDEKLC